MAYRMTAARRAALKRAQAISARKRRGTGKRKLSRKQKVAIAGGVASVGLATVATVAATGRVRSGTDAGDRGRSLKNSAPKAIGSRKKGKTLKTKNSGKRKRRVGKPNTSQKALPPSRKSGRARATKSKGSKYSDRRINAVKRRQKDRAGSNGERQRIFVNKGKKNTAVRTDHFNVASGLRQGKSRKKRRR